MVSIIQLIKKRKSFIWNSISGMITAGQSAVILIFISYNYTIYESGLFTIAYAIANLVYSLGKYGIRNFQVTDVRNKYRFSEYFVARVLTVILTVIFVAIFVILQHSMGKYTLEKSEIVFWFCLWKLIDAFEDVFWGMYQQKGRLDFAAKYYSLRLMLSTVLICVLLSFKIDFLHVTRITVISSIIASITVLYYTFSKMEETITTVRSSYVKKVLIECFPLCLGTTLAMFVGNIPKYMIDFYQDERSQALFGYIMLPAFMIMLLNGFIYLPMVREFGELYYQGEKDLFLSKVVKQCFVVVGLTGFVMVVSYFIGIPILNQLYNVDLSTLKHELMILLLGGGLYALVNFLMIPLTTMREQRYMAISFSIVAVLGVIIGKYLTVHYNIMGAVILYILINAVLFVSFFAAIVIGLLREIKYKKNL